MHWPTGVMNGRLAEDCRQRSGFVIDSLRDGLGRVVLFPHASHFNNT
jgi:hypothetical protein